jgi:uncharacterized Zn finger protein
MNMRNKHDRDPEWDKVSLPTQEEIIAFNVKEQERIITEAVESFMDDDWQYQENLVSQVKSISQKESQNNYDVWWCSLTDEQKQELFQEQSGIVDNKF